MSETEVWASWVFLEAPVHNPSLVSLPASRGLSEILGVPLFCRSVTQLPQLSPDYLPPPAFLWLLFFLTWTLFYISFWPSHAGFPHVC